MSKTNRRSGFTLIELLVVIAIIAILAAILFPVFTQAKVAAKKTAALSQSKQIGLSIHIYASDFNDVLPITSMTNSAHEWSTHAADTPSDWRWDPNANASAQDFVSRCDVFWTNSIQPYVKNYDMYGAGLPAKNVFPEPPRKKPAEVALAMNGFLNTLSLTNVDQISRVPLVWFGYGDQQFVGVGMQQPRLNCAGTGTCRFPTAHYSTYGDMGFTRRGWDGIKEGPWTGGNIYVHTDTSAKFFKMQGPGTVDSFNDTDPYTDYNGAGAGVAAAACRRPGDTQYFWCHFRPDWDFTYNGWEFIKQ